MDVWTCWPIFVQKMNSLYQSIQKWFSSYEDEIVLFCDVSVLEITPEMNGMIEWKKLTYVVDGIYIEILNLKNDGNANKGSVWIIGEERPSFLKNID